jgi:hypothetical protein
MTDTVVSATPTAYWSFDSDFGLLTSVNLATGASKTVKGKSGDGSIFDGFTNMALDGDGRRMKGLTPHVTEGGFW